MTSRKNVAASIRQRLLNISREEKIEFQLILTRFSLERFLFRLSQSQYTNDFVLKGAMLFQVWQESLQRPTRDLDLLSFGNPDEAYFTNVIAEICLQDFADDGLVFDSNSVQVGRIKEEDEYQGLRATLIARLDSARIPLQIDIGFGDSIVPAPVSIDFPTLLDLPSPKLKAYSQETVVAEKFHAMVHRGIANSRMKDFYDLWVLATKHQFNAQPLKDAISATFKRRATKLPVEPPLALMDEFTNDSVKMAQWIAFLRKSKLIDADKLSLANVVETIGALIMPLLSGGGRLRGEAKWNPESQEWVKD